MKRRRKRAKKSHRIIILLAIIAVPLFYLGKRVYKFADAVLEEKDFDKKRIVLRAESDVLRMRIDEYRKGNLTETRAREDLGMIREGEKVYLLRKE